MQWNAGPTTQPKEIMNHEDIIVGQQYKVNAAGTTAREWWTVVEKKLNRRDEYEIICSSPSSAHSRVFRPESLVKMKENKKMITERGALWSDGDDFQIYDEHVIYMPDQKRRGRKPAGELVNA